MLQQGRFVADLLYYNGDWAPNLAEPKHAEPSLGQGFDYDVCNAEVLLERVSVKGGRLVLPDGMSYRLLVLPERQAMPVEVMTKIQKLVKAGATIVGPKPERDPGLKHYPKCDQQVQALAKEVWGPCDGQKVKTHAFGRGRVFWGVPLREILQKNGVGPDFEYHQVGAFLDFIHRSTPELEIYFVVNRSGGTESLDCAFRVSGRAPELWDPVTGNMRGAQAFREEAGRTVVPLEFAPYQAWFVVFPKSKQGPKGALTGNATGNFPKLRAQDDLAGSWTVHFDPRWGGPAAIEFAQLEDWTQRPEEDIRYYSGAATYVKRFNLGQRPAGRLFLDLGVVHALASVRLNGQSLGVVWTAPWRVDITEAVRPQDNHLEIEVVNLWPNRLLGDAALPPEKRFTRTNIPLPKDAALLASGLLGPVTLQTWA